MIKYITFKGSFMEERRLKIKQGMQAIDKERKFFVGYTNDEGQLESAEITPKTWYKAFNSEIWSRCSLPQKIVTLLWFEQTLYNFHKRKPVTEFQLDYDMPIMYAMRSDFFTGEFVLRVNPELLADKEEKSLGFNVAAGYYSISIAAKLQALQNKAGKKGLASLTEEEVNMLDFMKDEKMPKYMFKAFYPPFTVKVSKEEKIGLAKFFMQPVQYHISRGYRFVNSYATKAQEELKKFDTKWEQEYTAKYLNVRRVEKWFKKYVSKDVRNYFSNGIKNKWENERGISR